MVPTFCIVDLGFAGVALRAAVARAATFVFAALDFAAFGTVRFDAFGFFADRLPDFFAAGFRDAVVRDAVLRLGDLFANVPSWGLRS
jgi:hypothetical protein